MSPSIVMYNSHYHTVATLSRRYRRTPSDSNSTHPLPAETHQIHIYPHNNFCVFSEEKHSGQHSTFLFPPFSSSQGLALILMLCFRSNSNCVIEMISSKTIPCHPMLFHENIRCTMHGFKAMSNDKSGTSYRELPLRYSRRGWGTGGPGLRGHGSFHSDLRSHGTQGGKVEDKKWISLTKLDRLVRDMKVKFRDWGAICLFSRLPEHP